MTRIDVNRHPDHQVLAEAVAGRLISTVVQAQAATGSASVVLTGGRIGTDVLAAIAASPARDSIEWDRLDIWWGDERYLPDGHPDRNDTGARAALLDQVRVDPARVHAVLGPDRSADPDEAAAAYAAELARRARPEDHGPVPTFDILLLSIGPDGHIASLFPEQPALHDQRACCAVRGAPKPPPTRVTLTMPTLNAAREVWILASGDEKAGAVAMALSGSAGQFQVPAAGVNGRERTLWLVDEDAARRLPPTIGRPSA
ncbi:MAG: 6-phosphogluconolactonase [Actinomycetota bacterium]|nr:6-phosphogluconolactonase [Actinomycetota bacterium]